MNEAREEAYGVGAEPFPNDAHVYRSTRCRTRRPGRSRWKQSRPCELIELHRRAPLALPRPRGPAALPLDRSSSSPRPH